MPDIEQYKLGHMADNKLVSRICNSSAIFEKRSSRYVVNELYVELVDHDGTVSFVTVTKEVIDAPRPEGVTIQAPEPLIFQQEKESRNAI